MTAVKYQTMPPLSTEEYTQLEQSILSDGVQVPIIVDDAGVVIDGHHRKRIAEHHGLHCPREVRSMLTEAQKTSLSISLNIARRQLNREQKRAIIEAAVKAEPQKPDYQHAKSLGVSDKTVTSVRKELEADSEIPNDIPRVNERGQERPATYKRTETTKEEFTEEVDGMTVDTRTGEIVDMPPVGLDGKEYKRPEPRVQKPVAEGDAAIQQNAEQGCLAIGRALDALESLTTPRRRDLILNDWWPRAHHNIMPQYTRLFTSTELRRIADGLNNLATDMEAHNEYE